MLSARRITASATLALGVLSPAALAVTVPVLSLFAGTPPSATAQVAPSSPSGIEPGDPAPAAVVTEIQAEVAGAVQRFERMDLAGLLASVSGAYRSGPLTKPLLERHLLAMFTAHDALRATVHIDEIRMIGDRAWIYSTGQVTGRLRLIGTPITIAAWERAPEVAWREGGRWRLIGDQQG